MGQPWLAVGDGGGVAAGRLVLAWRGSAMGASASGEEPLRFAHDSEGGFVSVEHGHMLLGGLGTQPDAPACTGG